MSTGRPPAAMPDRSNRLMLAGIVEIVMGGFCLLLVPMAFAMLAAQSQLQPAPGGAFGPAFVIQSLVTYLFAAVVFVSVGIDLMRPRRWAWALTVVGAWIWLVVGSIFFLVMILMVPVTSAMMAQRGNVAREFAVSMQIASVAMFAGLYIVVPGILLALCHGASARATCERRDPKPRWTDRCPLPVLAMSLFFAFGVVSLLSPATWQWTLPLFGIHLSGAAGAAIAVLIAGVNAYLAWGTYRLKPAAWWAALVVTVVGSADLVLVTATTDLFEMYKKVGLPAEDIEIMRKAGLFDSMSRWEPWLGAVGAIACVGYLLFVRRYFFGAKVPAPGSALGNGLR